MRIVVFGAGYVGLVTGICFASTGNSVTFLDPDRSKIDRLKKNLLPIYEPGLGELLTEAAKKGLVVFATTDDPSVAGLLREADVYFIAVGTPNRGDGRTS